MPLLEQGELGVGAREFGGESLVDVLQSADADLVWIGPVPGGPGCGSPLFELVLEMAPGSVEGRAGDPGLAGERLDVARPAARDPPAGRRSTAARIRLSTWSHWVWLSVMSSGFPVALSISSRTRSKRSCSACRRFFPPAGTRGLAREDGAAVGGGLPVGPVDDVVGGLRAAGAVAEPVQRACRGLRAGELAAQGLRRVLEPAVVRRRQVQHRRLLSAYT